MYVYIYTYIYSTMAHEYFLGTSCFFPAKFARAERGVLWRQDGLWASYNLNQRPKPIDNGVREIIPFLWPNNSGEI